jgi:fatty-acid desaturase
MHRQAHPSLYLIDRIPLARHGAFLGLEQMVGHRNCDNEATNLCWLAWISAGEGLHNRHHEYPMSPRLWKLP